MRGLLAAADRDTTRRAPRGPERLVTLADVEARAAELEANNLPHGRKSIADALGVSESTVQRRRAGN